LYRSFTLFAYVLVYNSIITNYLGDICNINSYKDQMYLRKSYRFGIWVLGIAAGLLYISWPLGYWLNPSVSKNSLASGLEAVGQPYNWLFVMADVVSSLLVIALCWALWSALKRRQSIKPIPVALMSVALFGIGTIVDALLPEHCVPNLEQCPSFTQNHALLIHGVFSILASVFLFVSLCVMWYYQRQSVILNSLLLGYVLFGLVSLIEAVAPGNEGNWSQHYYITLCGVWLMFIPYVIERSTLKLSTQTVRLYARSKR
jgi:heme A synthase